MYRERETEWREGLLENLVEVVVESTGLFNADTSLSLLVSWSGTNNGSAVDDSDASTSSSSCCWCFSDSCCCCCWHLHCFRLKSISREREGDVWLVGFQFFCLFGVCWSLGRWSESSQRLVWQRTSSVVLWSLYTEYPFSLRDRRVRGERNKKSLLSLFVYNGLFSEEALGHLRKKTSQTRQLREEIKDSLTLQFSFFF